MTASLVSEQQISGQRLRTFLQRELRRAAVKGRKVLVIIPDNTRTLPMPALFSALHEDLSSRVEKLTFLIAGGTHSHMTNAEIREHLGMDWRKTGAVVLQHEWESPDALVHLGTLEREDVRSLSGGVLDEDLPVKINRLVLDHELALLIGPVFPHELIGFSGGYKYFFPGVSGPEIVHQSHWLGSIVVFPALNGRKHTPVREMIHRAAALVPTPTLGVSLVMDGRTLKGVFTGAVEEAWEKAADLSAQLNIVRVEKPFHTVVACVPKCFKDLWMGAKCQAKLENVVADRGRLILYAPHINRASLSHGDWHQKIGYHLPQYVLQNMDSFRHVPKAVLGDLVQLRGTGIVRDGKEFPRIEVILASAIPREECLGMNIGYQEPMSIRLEEYEKREDEGILVVREAGEKLWKIAETGYREDSPVTIQKRI